MSHVIALCPSVHQLCLLSLTCPYIYIWHIFIYHMYIYYMTCLYIYIYTLIYIWFTFIHYMYTYHICRYIWAMWSLCALQYTRFVLWVWLVYIYTYIHWCIFGIYSNVICIYITYVDTYERCDSYGVATISRLLKMIGLFCRI